MKAAKPDAPTPVGIVPTAVYNREQVCAALQIGDTKLRELVADGALRPLAFTTHWRFIGQRLVELCLRESDGEATS